MMIPRCARSDNQGGDEVKFLVYGRLRRDKFKFWSQGRRARYSGSGHVGNAVRQMSTTQASKT